MRGLNAVHARKNMPSGIGDGGRIDQHLFVRGAEVDLTSIR
jgi:hypothetical protein